MVVVTLNATSIENQHLFRIMKIEIKVSIRSFEMSAKIVIKFAIYSVQVATANEQRYNLRQCLAFLQVLYLTKPTTVITILPSMTPA